MKQRLLWIGDAACDSGFARATEYICDVLSHEFQVFVMGINYRGDDHPFRRLIESRSGQVFPAWVPGCGPFGVQRVVEKGAEIRPDIVVIQNDPWNIPAYIEKFKVLAQATEGKVKPTLVGFLAVDGKNLRKEYLEGLDQCIFWTKFAEAEAREGGYTGRTAVVGLGVDRSIYFPGSRAEAREAIGWPEQIPKDAFVFINVNRNQPRKRLDLTFDYFAAALNQGVDAYLYLHVAPTGDVGWDCRQLTHYFGLRGRVIMAEPGVYKGTTEKMMAMTYRGADALISTTQGEGWGLTTLEAMACGLPCIVPDWSALGEWAAPAAALVPCSQIAITSNGRCNVIGATPDKTPFVQAMVNTVNDWKYRAALAHDSLLLASEEQFDWKVIGQKFTDTVSVAHHRTLLGV